MFREFRSFLLRSKAMDFAIAFVMGQAFLKLIADVQKDVASPWAGAALRRLGLPDYGIGAVPPNYGDVLAAVGAFLFTGAVVFYLVVKPVRLLIRHSRTDDLDPRSEKRCTFCLSVIDHRASRCPQCTSDLMVA
ncbi:MAG: MscL family protein [Candidatus Dormibacteria bacterium]